MINAFKAGATGNEVTEFYLQTMNIHGCLDCGGGRRKEKGSTEQCVQKDDMCEAHICEAIRKAVPSAKRVSASRSKNEASFLTAEAVDADRLKAAVNATGYTCLGIESVPYEKKGLFGRI